MTYQCLFDAVILKFMASDHSTIHSRQRERSATNSSKGLGKELSGFNKTSRAYALAGALVLLGFLLFLFSQNTKVRTFYDLASAFLRVPVGQVHSSGGRINVLIMGVSGADHEGSDLTDTMILASVSTSKPSLVLVSIPRDLWIPNIRAKVNSAYHYGSFPLAEESVSRVTGFPVEYSLIADFSAFKEIIDELGGVAVNVERGFTDNLYPIAGKENDLCGGDRTYSCRYETVSFSPGTQLMDGVTALKFVRSRHAEGEEGTDTAREARQQKVIDAIKNKLLSPQIFLNPAKDLAILRIVRSSVKTDIHGIPGAIILRKIVDSRSFINQFLIPPELLYNPPINSVYDNQYVFIPKSGNGAWREINAWFSSVLGN